MRNYQFKLYARTRKSGTTGELLKSVEIEAPGLAQAAEIARRDHLHEIDFDWRFAILEGDSGFVSCWMSPQDA